MNNSEGRTPRVRNHLSIMAQTVVGWAGSAVASIVAVVGVISWVLIGVIIGFSQGWLAALFAATGAATFVMVFFIQHTTGRQLRAVSLKLDELIAATAGANQSLIAAERRSLQEQDEMERRHPLGL
ncbi:MAG TPA: low affinity iron permease family protein [Mycobacteriales bacterium]|jgi:low affinity Fe/Cu permease|nr:low affinity iron permease family protein [Mycobacteriales bacterium]